MSKTIIAIGGYPVIIVGDSVDLCFDGKSFGDPLSDYQVYQAESLFKKYNIERSNCSSIKTQNV